MAAAESGDSAAINGLLDQCDLKLTTPMKSPPPTPQDFKQDEVMENNQANNGTGAAECDLKFTTPMKSPPPTPQNFKQDEVVENNQANNGTGAAVKQAPTMTSPAEVTTSATIVI